MVSLKVGHTCLVCRREVVVPVVNLSTNSLPVIIKQRLLSVWKMFILHLCADF